MHNIAVIGILLATLTGCALKSTDSQAPGITLQITEPTPSPTPSATPTGPCPSGWNHPFPNTSSADFCFNPAIQAAVTSQADAQAGCRSQSARVCTNIELFVASPRLGVYLWTSVSTPNGYPLIFIRANDGTTDTASLDPSRTSIYPVTSFNPYYCCKDPAN